jgi:hypothetical protein
MPEQVRRGLATHGNGTRGSIATHSSPAPLRRLPVRSPRSTLRRTSAFCVEAVATGNSAAMERSSIPFSFKELNATWTNYTRVSGLLHKEADALVVEFREKTTDFNTMAEEKSPLHTVRIRLGEIECSLAAVDGLPNSDGPDTHFDIAWRDRVRAWEFTSTATLQLLDRRLKELSEGET